MCIFTNKTTDTCFQYNLSGGTTITGHTPFREWSVQNNYTGNTVGYWTNQTGDVYMSGGTAVTGYTAFTFVSPCVGELIESGTVLAAGGTLSAITQTNPYAEEPMDDGRPFRRCALLRHTQRRRQQRRRAPLFPQRPCF